MDEGIKGKTGSDLMQTAVLSLSFIYVLFLNTTGQAVCSCFLMYCVSVQRRFDSVWMFLFFQKNKDLLILELIGFYRTSFLLDVNYP